MATAVDVYPEELEVGDLIVCELPSGDSLGFQVRSTIGPWLRVIGPVDGDLAEAVGRPEMANVVILSSPSERRAAKARVVGRFDVPHGSRGEPPYRRPGLGPVAPGVRGTGTWLHAPHGDPLFVAEPTEEHRRALADRRPAGRARGPGA